ncbi:MAG: citrate lyase subunit alpha [Bacilli bacterium]|jgi:citrate lyase subunit alpha/citrate CoA-transferase|nr:citrate lyase subunit alpha [Acholeplasmataceae bacterium]
MSRFNPELLPASFVPFASSSAFTKKERTLIPEKEKSENVVYLHSIPSLFDELKITDGMTLSFHHHLRNGDYVFNMVMEEIKRRNLKNIHLAPSAIFPNNQGLSELIENSNVTNITTNYLNGPVAETIGQGKMQGLLIMDTHGGRARAIESGDLKIDVAILSTPAVDHLGNGNGIEGPSACGSLGYAISDLKYAKKVVLVTDYVIDSLKRVDFPNEYVDYVVKLDKIGDPKGIVSGTTKITKDPIGLKIARNTVKLLDELGFIKEGLSMQTGAGGTSLAVAQYVKEKMQEKQIKGSFASGGITGYIVDMLKEGLFEKLYDVQCFDLQAVKSIKTNPSHIPMSASVYANPFDPKVIVDKLDFVILGATEIDTNFNVNVTTDSKGLIIGGSGGHSDTAFGAKVTIITSSLIKSRLPIIKDKVTIITTPGEDVDILVTERGIAINPKRTDLLQKLTNSKLKIVPIEKLLETSHKITGEPNRIELKNKVIGLVRYRDGAIIDLLYQYK